MKKHVIAFNLWLHTKFEQLQYYKNWLKIDLKMNGQYGVQTYFTLKF
jgi:hypothetical protein